MQDQSSRINDSKQSKGRNVFNRDLGPRVMSFGAVDWRRRKGTSECVKEEFRYPLKATESPHTSCGAEDKSVVASY